MKRSPAEFSKVPPSPRTPSVTRMPRTLGGQTIPVGWNWTFSMSMRSAPTSIAMPMPSPLYSQELEVTCQHLPEPPVASTTALQLNTINSPLSRQ